MSYIETIDGNKLIAEFLGLYVTDFNGTYHFVCKDEQKNKDLNQAWLFRLKEAKYHSSWEWLMPVVDKIEGLGYDSRIHNYDSESTYFVDFVDVMNENTEAACVSKHYTEANKIQTVWLAVVEFIQWHNKETNPNQ